MNNKLKRLIKLLGIKVEVDNHCHAEMWNRTIFINKGASDYDVAHEICHIICGYGCCREHCEWEAHGGAKVLCELFGVDKKEVEDAEERMGCYAFRTNPEACARYDGDMGIISTYDNKEYISSEVFINEFWLEHLLNLFSQGYFGEFWEEIQINNLGLCKSVEEFVYPLLNEVNLQTILDTQNINKEREED